MSIIITKGVPITMMIGVSQNDIPVTIGDGSWNVEVFLRHKTDRGAEPFPIVGSIVSNKFVIDITAEQTSTLNHRDNCYVLVIKASKTNGTVNLRNTLQVSVVNDL